jgi:hypothetical protein
MGHLGQAEAEQFFCHGLAVEPFALGQAMPV